MLKGRIVFLFGAGAVLPWNAPKTSDITDLILKIGFRTSDNKTTITQFIFDRLVSKGFSKIDINFETLINVIEEMIVYYSNFNSNEATPSLLSSLFINGYEDAIFNFSIKGDEEKHGYQLNIPRGVEYEYSRYAFNKENPKQFFLLHLLDNLLEAIASKISKYAYQTETHTVIDAESTVSKSFVHWMAMQSNSNTLRLYTLNYDRLFKILLERNGINMFEGFDCGEYIPLSSKLSANVPRILFDMECNTHYNIHGSAYWEILPYDKNQLPNPEVVLSSGLMMKNHNYSSYQIEKGKTLLVTNIITGYQKAQKSFFTPFRQIQSIFDRDCCVAESIYIIGYSFGDEHINQILKTAVRHNSKVKIIVVDPYFIKNEMDIEFAKKLFSYKQGGDMSPRRINENLYSYFGDTFLVHTVTFEEFVKSKIS